MQRRRSLVWRITLVLTGLTTLAISLATLIAFQVYQHMEASMIDTLLQTESSRLVSRFSRFGPHWAGPLVRDLGPAMFAWGESPRHLAASLPDALRALTPGLHTLALDDSLWRVHVANAMDGRLYLRYDVGALEQQSTQFAAALLGIVLGGALLTLAISHRIARWLTTPLHTLAKRLLRWTQTPGRPLPPVTNEADRLMAIFSQVQDQMDTALAHQREFTDNLHHEIRTPLTVIRSDAELLIGLAARGQDPRPRLQRIVQSVQAIQQSLESTYHLAHVRATPNESVALRECVQDIIESLRPEIEPTGLSVLNRVGAEQHALVSRHALMTVMRNLVRNAARHAAPTTLEIQAIPKGVRFIDAGPGIAPELLPHIFERHVSASPEDDAHPHGLGLAIVHGICLLQGWTLTAHSPWQDGHGTAFTLHFGTTPHEV